jgi:hypothetical protein
VQALGFSKPQEGEAQPTEGSPADAIQLVSYPRPCMLHSTGTPFGGKLELMLRISGLPYEGLSGMVTNPKVAPKHKVRQRRTPYIKYGLYRTFVQSTNLPYRPRRTPFVMTLSVQTLPLDLILK